MKKLLLTTFLSICFLLLLFSSYVFSQWVTSLSNAGQIWAIAINASNQQIQYAGSNTTGVWKTTNGGTNWVQTNSGLLNLSVQAMAISRSNPDILYCGTSQTGASAGIYKSTDAGATWNRIVNGIQETSVGIQSIAIDPTNPNNAYVAVFDGLVDSPQGLYKTTDGGATWNVANTGIGTIKNFLSLVINPLNVNVVYAGSSFGVVSQMGPAKVYKSVNAGASWTDMSTGLPSLATDIKPVRCLSISTADTAVLLAGLFMNTDTLGGMFVTTNGAGLWTRRQTGIPSIVGNFPRSCLIRPGSTTEFYAGLGNAGNTGIGVFRTTNAGLSWTDFNSGTLSNTTTIRALNFITSINRLCAGGAHPTVTTGQGVFYNDLPTGIGNQISNIPNEFILKQNYPNPFNPGTKIKFVLPQDVRRQTQDVSLLVYDAIGREVAILVNEKLSAGSYEVDFNANNYPSGVYFYKLVIDGVLIDTKRMTLLK